VVRFIESSIVLPDGKLQVFTGCISVVFYYQIKPEWMFSMGNYIV